MTDDELKQLVASLAIAQKKTDKQFKETDKQIKKTDKQIKETSKQLKELGQQIGGLGKKFGSFTEGLALPSMTKILRERFKMEVISPSVRVSKNGIDAEIDVLAYANSAINEVYVVEVKSHLREEAITQLNNLMANFKTLFPEHKDKKLYGIIAAVDMSEILKQRVLSAGFYMARIQEDTFTLDIPDTFQAKCF
jgi:septal ring factor EnvC (AmiA/AmiB activator)